MGTYYTHADGVVQHYGTRDVENALTREATGGDITKTLVVDFDYSKLGATVATWFTKDASGGSTPDSPSLGNAYIPSNSYIKSAKLFVQTAFVGATAALNIGTYTSAGAEVDADGIDAAIAVGALTADTVISCDGAQVGTLVTQDCYIAADYDTTAFTAGTARLIIEYMPNRP